MKSIGLSIVLPLAVLSLLAGCQTPPLAAGDNAAVVCSDTLQMSMQLGARTFTVGQTLPVTIKVRNVSGSPVTIQAKSGAPVYIHLSRRLPLFEEEFKTYPEASSMVMDLWTLMPGETRTFDLTLPVEADWPKNEPIHLVGELNGVTGLSPAIVVTVVSAK